MAAQRYRDLQRPTLIDVAARSTPNGSSEAMNALADSLASFSRTGFAITAPIIERNLVKSGTEAGQEVTGTPEFKSTMTAYGRAYNNAALRSYAIRSEVDLNEQAARLEVEAGTNPEAFRSAMEEMQKGVISEAPPEAQGILTEMYTRRAGEGLARIQGALATELRAEDRILVQTQISNLTEKVSFLRAQDTLEAHQQSVEEEAKLFALLDATVADGTISESEGRIARKNAETGIIRETVMSRFDNELNSPYGDPIGFIQDLKEANRTAQTLTPEEEGKLENDLMAELREHNGLRAAQQSQMAAEAEARYDAGDRDATIALLSRQLTQSGLLQRLRDDSVRPGLARTLLNELQSPTAAPKSDPETLFTVGVNVLDFSEDEIATMSGLTWGDRLKLVEQRRTEETGWKSTQVAKEAFSRIDRALGIVPGANRRMLSDEEARARDVARTMLYDRIEALPPEERQSAILSESADVVKTAIRERASTQAERARTMLQRYKESVGDPAEMNERERQQYNTEISRYENIIREAEQKSAQ